MGIGGILAGALLVCVFVLVFFPHLDKAYDKVQDHYLKEKDEENEVVYRYYNGGQYCEYENDKKNCNSGDNANICHDSFDDI